MRNWLYLHGRSFLRALHRLGEQPFGTLLSALVMGIALALPAGGYILLDNVASLARGVSGTPEISLFLDETPDVAAQTEDIQHKLKAEPAVASIRYVPRDEALRQLESNGLGDVLGGLAANPLPDAFVVTLRSDDPGVYDALTAKMRGWAGVTHVRLDSAWVKRLSALLELGRVVLLVLAVLLGLALVIVTFNTIRLQILTQTSEIEVSRLLGATNRFIRRPFYWFGSLQGILGGLIAVGAVWLGVVVLTEPVARVAETYGAVIALTGPNWQQSAAVVGFAAALGWLGAALSVRRHLRGA
ncbi:MAG: permease-like cell division protein FtsX [Azoarcus sp.]|jgi:cell division transport system permease protein|nr:permease-like cell division protein FtsX [Azoarcus sp.]